MKTGYYGGIDIGTNGARLVIKDTFFNSQHEVDSVEVQKVRIPLRLGVDVYKTGGISDKKLQQIILTMKSFKAIMDIYDVIDYSCLATSAMREASNGKEVIEKVYNETGIKIEIIDGETEAKTVSKIAKDFNLGEEKYVFIDVGGGSTELTLLNKGKPIESNSFELGTLRILAKKDKLETWDRFENKLFEYYKKYGNLNIVGTGGNINRYWKMSKKKNKKDVNILEVETLKELYEKLIEMSIGERIEAFNLKPDRADVIIPAGKIFIKAANILDSKTIIVPMIGLSDGIVDQLIQDNINVI